MNRENMKITNNFYFYEIFASKTATRKGIRQDVSFNELNAAFDLAHHILQPTRDRVGRIKINSWKRNPYLNKVIGGAKASQHLTGQAADIVPLDTNIITVFNYIKDNLEYDQLILEYSSRTGKVSWIHVSYNEGNNRNKSFYMKSGKIWNVKTKVS